jgi:hypothetical protein
LRRSKRIGLRRRILRHHIGDQGQHPRALIFVFNYIFQPKIQPNVL